MERIQRENPKNQKTLRKPTGNNIWRLFGETLLTKSKKLRENQKTKKPKLFRECLVWGSCLVFFGFFLVLTLKKLKKTKFFLVFWINWWFKNCEKPKKTQGFFGFWMFVALVSFWLCNEKPKKPWVFLVFHNSLTINLSKKPKKTLFFFSFFKVKTKKNQKNLGKTKKNQTWASDQTFSEKFWFFGFLVFSRFWWFCISYDSTQTKKTLSIK